MARRQKKFRLEALIFDEEKMDARLEQAAENIRMERERQGLSVSRLAQLANLSTSCVSKAEAATGGIGVKSLLKIAAALEVPVAELLRAEETPKRSATGAGEEEYASWGNCGRIFEQVTQDASGETADLLLSVAQELVKTLRNTDKEKEK